MPRLRIALINGPNLNLLGTREPEKYGNLSLPTIEAELSSIATSLDASLVSFQFNGEGEIIDCIHKLHLEDRVNGVIINAGAYSHTSLAIRDALVGVSLPYVEVHLTNVFAREPERHTSMLASHAVGSICGFGSYGYEAALRFLVGRLKDA